MSPRSGLELFSLFLLLVLLLTAPRISEAGKADPLLKRLPPDAAVTLCVEDLSEHVRELLDSPAATAFLKLPAVRSWQQSQGAQQFRAARQQVEATLGVPLAKLRDDLLGDAFVLCFHVPSDRGLDEGKGLLVVQPRDRALLEKIVRLVNDLQTAKGEVESLSTKDHAGASITVKHFKRKERAAEYYVVLPDGLFAWSNDEGLIRGVIDRGSRETASLAGQPEFQELRAALPSRSFLSLFVRPAFLTQLVQISSANAKPSDRRFTESVVRALKATNGIGLAIELRGGVLLHMHQSLRADAVADWAKAWAGRRASTDALIRKVPRTSLGKIAGVIDLTALHQGVVSLLSETERPRFDQFKDLLKGLLLGHDPVQAILPQLGPEAVFYVEASRRTQSLRFDAVGVISLAESDQRAIVAASLDNALRTLLTLYALDPKRKGLPLRVETMVVRDRKVTRITGGPSPFIYAVEPAYLIVGSSTDAVAGFGHDGNFVQDAKLKAEYFPEAQWYSFVELGALAELARSHRSSLAKKFGGESEFDQAVGVLELFPKAIAGVTVARDLRSIHGVVGLIGSPKSN